MNIYRVDFIETLGDETFSTFVNVRAKSEEDAESQVIKTQKKLAHKWYKNKPIDILTLSVTKVSSTKDRLLDRLWDYSQDLYIDLWEPDIPTRTMIKKLMEQYPDIYRILAGE